MNFFSLRAILTTTTWFEFRQWTSKNKLSPYQYSGTHLPEIESNNSGKFLKSHCMTKYVDKIEDLATPDAISWNLTLRGCKDAKIQMGELFKIELLKGHLKVTPALEEVARGWFQMNYDTFKKYQDQFIINVQNRWLLTTTIRNPFRELKPSKKISTQDAWKVSKDIIEKTKDSCDLCVDHYEDHTAEDIFGRITNVSGIFTAANSFLFGDFHGMIFPIEHNPFKMSPKDFKGLFEAADLWFKKVHALTPDHTHPMILWDVMPHGGASQVHPHFHTVMGRDEYLGKYLHLEDVISRYFEESSRFYFQDYINAHIAVGLAIKVGTAIVISPIDAWKNHELLIVGESVDEDWLTLLYDVYRVYVEDLNIMCWSSGMALPPLGTEKSPFGAVARIGSREDCTSHASDVSSLDLYAFYSIDTDPFDTITRIKNRLNRERTEILKASREAFSVL